MKKRILTAALSFVVVFSMMFALTACGTRGDCDFCGETNIRIEERNVFGETIGICQDCLDEIR